MGKGTPQAQGICDASGFEFPLRDLVKQWDGALVAPRFVDKRNPQDFVQGVRESVLPYTRPEAPDVFLVQTLTARDMITVLQSRIGLPLTGKELSL